MDPTVAVAALGFASTLVAAWLSARWQQRGLVQTEILTARVEAYASCAEALYEFERVSYNRAVTKFRNGLDEPQLAQEVYQRNSAARASIGRLAILTDRTDLWQRLDDIRKKVREMHDLAGEPELRAEHQKFIDELGAILASVRDRFDDFQGR